MLVNFYPFTTSDFLMQPWFFQWFLVCFGLFWPSFLSQISGFWDMSILHHHKNQWFSQKPNLLSVPSTNSLIGTKMWKIWFYSGSDAPASCEGAPASAVSSQRPSLEHPKEEPPSQQELPAEQQQHVPHQELVAGQAVGEEACKWIIFLAAL